MKSLLQDTKKISLLITLKIALIFAFAIVSLTYFTTLAINNQSKSGRVKQESVSITGTVLPSEINIKVYPEKRIPATSNWATTANVQIRPTGTTTPVINRDNLQIDANGDATITILESESLPPRLYDFSIKGLSHLRRNYESYLLGGSENTFNLALTGDELLAGDINVESDNVINLFDMTGLITNMFTDDNVSDLNQDGEVNSLDLSNQIYNFGKTGDT